MNIVIVGAGKLGRLLTRHLLDEKHDIIIIDKNQAIVSNIINEYDVKGVCGNGASLDCQVASEVEKADLLISATSSDEVNILCCLVAKKLGVKQTIARVRDPEYSKQVRLMNDELGISMTVNPELDTANEISRMLRFPSAIKVETFANGRVDLVEIKITDDSPLASLPLHAVKNKIDVSFLICAVKRGENVFIPKGDFVIEKGDNVYITADSTQITTFFKKMHILKERSKRAMIIGGGKIAYYLAKDLISSGVFVKIFERDEKRCTELSEKLPQAIVINDDGTNHKELLEEGLETMDSLLTLTGMDETNIVISTFAKRYNLNKIITKVNNSNYNIIVESVGLESVVTPKEISSSNIIRYVRGMESGRGGEFKTLHRFVENKVEALEFLITSKTSFTSLPIKDLKFKDNTILACIIRENDVIIPHGMNTIEVFDSVIIFTTNPHIKDFADALK